MNGGGRELMCYVWSGRSRGMYGPSIRYPKCFWTKHTLNATKCNAVHEVTYMVVCSAHHLNLLSARVREPSWCSRVITINNGAKSRGWGSRSAVTNAVTWLRVVFIDLFGSRFASRLGRNSWSKSRKVFWSFFWRNRRLRRDRTPTVRSCREFIQFSIVLSGTRHLFGDADHTVKLVCLLWIVKARAKDKKDIWISVRWKAN